MEAKWFWVGVGIVTYALASGLTLVIDMDVSIAKFFGFVLRFTMGVVSNRWMQIDADERGLPRRGRVATVLTILFAFIAVPYYLFRTRGFPRVLWSYLKLALVLGVLLGINEIRTKLAYQQSPGVEEMNSIEE